MKVFWDIIELASTLFENYVILSAIILIFGHRYDGIKGKVYEAAALIATTAYVTLMNHYFAFEGMLSLTIMVVYFACAMVVAKGNFFAKLLMTVILFSLIIVINITVTYGMSVVLGMPKTVIFSSSDGTRLMALFLTKIIYFAVTRIVVHMCKKDSFELAKRESLLLIFMFILLFIVCTILIRIQMKYSETGSMVLVAIFCAMLLYVFTYYMLCKISKEHSDKLRISLLELQLSEQKNLMEEAGQVNKDIRKTEHDLKHHLLSVLGMIKMGKTEHAEHYLQDLLHQYEASVFRYVQLENCAIASILNFKIGRCHLQNIDMKIEIETDFAGIAETDVCVILANTLDNAIEASEQISSPQILVRVSNEKGYLRLNVKNKIERSVLAYNSKLLTTKDDKEKHGLGGYSVSQIVERYDGMKDYYEDEDYFVVDIWLKRANA